MTTQNHQSHQKGPRKLPEAQGEAGLNISELSRLTGVDRAQLRRNIAEVKPCRVDGTQKFYRLADIQAVMANKPSKSLKDEETLEKIRKLRISNDKAESKLVLKTEVAASIRRALSGLSQILESKLVNEWPSRVTGISPEDARAYGRILADDILAQGQALEREFPT